MCLHPGVVNLEMKALSHDRIRVGCAEFSRETVMVWKDVTAQPFEGTVFRYGAGFTYWLTEGDCDRALKLMDEWRESKPVASEYLKHARQLLDSVARDPDGLTRSYSARGLAGVLHKVIKHLEQMEEAKENSHETSGHRGKSLP